MGNMIGADKMSQLGNSLGSQQGQDPGMISSMILDREMRRNQPKKTFLAGQGWKPPAGWSPFDQWTSTDVAEGSANAGKSLSKAVRLAPGSMSSPNTGINPRAGNMISNMVSTQPVPTSSPMEIGQAQGISQTASPTPVSRKKRKNKPMSPYGTANPGSMGMY